MGIRISGNMLHWNWATGLFLLEQHTTCKLKRSWGGGRGGWLDGYRDGGGGGGGGGDCRRGTCSFFFLFRCFQLCWQTELNLKTICCVVRILSMFHGCWDFQGELWSGSEMLFQFIHRPHRLFFSFYAAWFFHLVVSSRTNMVHQSWISGNKQMFPEWNSWGHSHFVWSMMFDDDVISFSLLIDIDNLGVHVCAIQHIFISIYLLQM